MAQLFESIRKSLGLGEKKPRTFRIIGLSYRGKDDAVAVTHDENNPARAATFQPTKDNDWIKKSVGAALTLSKRGGSAPLIEIMPTEQAIEFAENER
jgi:hypothetical protein